MLKTGLTGSIGSGKTIVAKLFNTLNTPIFFADTEARNILNKAEIKQSVLEITNSDILDDVGNIDRKKLAQIIFNDKNKFIALNDLIHPAVIKLFQKWTEQYSDRNYVIQEAAILFETGYYKVMDKNIVVVAPMEMRIERVMQRDKISREEVLQRIKNQWKDEDKILLADYVIVNDGAKMLIPQVMEIHQQLIKNASE
jgi:dephospho-CoA kinase